MMLFEDETGQTTDTRKKLQKLVKCMTEIT